MAVVNVEESEGFRENFLEPALDPSWQVVSGLGSYSLTDNLGYLRYYLKGSSAYSGGWRKDYKVETWRPSLTLLRPFEGRNWILKAKATYNIHACADVNVPKRGSTGAQYQDLYIAFGEGVNDFLVINRGTDWWYGTNRMEAKLISNGVEIASCTLLAPDDVVKQKGNEGWFVHTYWYEVARSGQEITFRYSCDGKNYVESFSASLTKPIEAIQKVIMDANVWTTAGSYVDWDYFNVESFRVENLPVIAIMGVGKSYAERLEAQEVKTIRDMSLADVFTLGKKTGTSLFKLYMWKRRASLAMDVKIDRALFSNILKMRLGDIIAMPDGDLCSKANQPMGTISDLKRDISTLLISLDNAIVKSMTLEKMAT
jgi:hypothetical protein